jgi:hypothetical protein
VNVAALMTEGTRSDSLLAQQLLQDIIGECQLAAEAQLVKHGQLQGKKKSNMSQRYVNQEWKRGVVSQWLAPGACMHHMPAAAAQQQTLAEQLDEQRIWA